jgi:protein-S-isoprenylcysteine O-methyltransferase Ste14
MGRLPTVADELSDEQRREAAAGDVNVLAILMLLGSAGFGLVNRWIGTMSWLAVALSVLSTTAWSLGLWRRSPVTTSFVKIGFGFGGLAAPVFGILGVVAVVFGFTWGWAVIGGALVYFAFSLLGLEIIERAYDTGVIDSY